MKKILSLIGTVSLVVSTSSTIIACGSHVSLEQPWDFGISKTSKYPLLNYQNEADVSELELFKSWLVTDTFLQDADSYLNVLTNRYQSGFDNSLDFMNQLASLAIGGFSSFMTIKILMYKKNIKSFNRLDFSKKSFIDENDKYLDVINFNNTSMDLFTSFNELIQTNNSLVPLQDQNHLKLLTKVFADFKTTLQDIIDEHNITVNQ